MIVVTDNISHLDEPPTILYVQWFQLATPLSVPMAFTFA